MKLKQIYEDIIQIGIKNDPRKPEDIQRDIDSLQKEYKGIKEKDRPYFDTERLKNPYADTRILCGDPKTEVKTVLSGIDMEIGEVLLAEKLREKGRHIDAIVSHHPEGTAMAAFYRVMKVQADIFNQLGVSVTVAEALLEERMKEVAQKIMPINHNRAIMAAQLLDIPFMCCHTPADNSVNKFLQGLFEEKKPYLVEDIIDILMEIPEYQQGAKLNAGPKVLVGKEKGRCGKIHTDMTGGTSGPKAIYKKLAQEGIGTVVGMHMNEDHKKEAEESHINVVIAGHMASDSLGMNLVFDKLRELGKGPLEVIPCSGLIYHSRA
ncbi:NGG1p interacting factor NIF3 [bacterium]|nr:NGG1p interacting factor NIF3 [bacterium]